MKRFEAVPPIPPDCLISVWSFQGERADVMPHRQGFAVLVRDTESGKTLPTVRIFPKIELAERYAEKIMRGESPDAD